MKKLVVGSLMILFIFIYLDFGFSYSIFCWRFFYIIILKVSIFLLSRHHWLTDLSQLFINWIHEYLHSMIVLYSIV